MMNETVTATRTFNHPKCIATAKLYSLGEQEPYFSITTSHGADHEKILKHMPELQLLVDVHLCSVDGQPMHGLSNARYNAENGDYDAVERSTGVKMPDDLIKEYDTVIASDRRRSARAYPNVDFDAWYKSLTPHLQKRANDALTMIKDGIGKYESVEIAEGAATVTINGTVMVIESVSGDDEDGFEINVGHSEYIAFTDLAAAEHKVASSWEAMAHHNPSEFIELLSAEQIIQWWVSGQSFENIITQLASEQCESHLASYNGCGSDGTCNDEAVSEYGLSSDMVFYRTN